MPVLFFYPLWKYFVFNSECKFIKYINYFRLKRVYHFIHTFLLFGFILRYIIEGYLELSVLCFINLKALKFNTAFQALTSVTVFIVLIIVILFPVFVPLFLYKNRKRFSEKLFKDRFNTLYEELKTDHYLLFIYQFLFLMRRLIFSFTLIFLMKGGMF